MITNSKLITTLNLLSLIALELVLMLMSKIEESNKNVLPINFDYLGADSDSERIADMIMFVL